MHFEGIDAKQLRQSKKSDLRSVLSVLYGQETVRRQRVRYFCRKGSLIGQWLQHEKSTFSVSLHIDACGDACFLF